MLHPSLRPLLLAASVPWRGSGWRCAGSRLDMCDDAAFPLLTSSTNPRLKLIKKLHTRRHREREGLVLLVRARPSPP